MLLRFMCTCDIFSKLIRQSNCVGPIRYKYVHTSRLDLKPMKEGYLRSFKSFYGAVVTKVEKKVEKRAPKLIKSYYNIKWGLRDFWSEALDFQVVLMKLKQSDDMNNLTLQELTAYFETPKSVKKIVPILILLILPFGFSIIVPLAYYFPHVFLTRHFKSQEQKNEYISMQHRKQLPHLEHVLRHLSSNAEFNISQDFRNLIGCLKTGSHPHISIIAKCAPLFHERRQLSLETIPSEHLKHLRKLHNITFDWNLVKVYDLAKFIMYSDRAIVRQMSTLNELQIKELCVRRGFYALNVTKKEAKEQLLRWLEVSKYFTEENPSLILHAPIFLWYNHPVNRDLIISL